MNDQEESKSEEGKKLDECGALSKIAFKGLGIEGHDGARDICIRARGLDDEGSVGGSYSTDRVGVGTPTSSSEVAVG